MSGLTIAEKRLALPDDCAAVGRGVVQLRNERGRVVHEEPFENFIGIVGLAYQKWMNRRTFNMPPAGSSLIDPANYGAGVPYNAAHVRDEIVTGDAQPTFPFQVLVVTTDTRAETPLTEKGHWGDIVAWSDRAAYSGADTKRGTPSPAETTYSTTQVKHVFDWPTHSGIGTFRSIGWMASAQQSAALGGYGHVPAGRAASSKDRTNWSSYYNMGGAEYDAASDMVFATHGPGLRVKAWGTDSSSIDWGASSPTNQVNLTGDLRGIAIIGSEMFVTNYANRTVSVYPLSTSGSPALARTFSMDDVASVTNNTDSEKYLIAGSDTHFYGGKHDGTNLKVFKKNPSDGAVVTTYTIPRPGGATAISLAAHPTNGEFYVLWNTGRIGRYHGTTGALLEMHGNSPVTSHSGLFLKSGALWVQSDGYLYQMEPHNLGSRTLLGAAVTKSALQTMKITYQFDFV